MIRDISQKEQKFISVVAYVHNGAKELPAFLDTVMGACDALFAKCELILVEDCSDDGSLQVIRSYYAEKPADYMVSIIKMGAYQGMESAMNAGRDMAIGDYVYEFDDLFVDYEAGVLENAYRKCLEGNDIVGVGCNAKMRLTSRLFYRIYNKASNTRHQLGQETFRILSRRAINRVKSMGSYIPYRKAVYLNCGLRCDHIVYQSTSPEELTRHSRTDERTGLALDSFIYFTNVMERISFGIAICVLLPGHASGLRMGVPDGVPLHRIYGTVRAAVHCAEISFCRHQPDLPPSALSDRGCGEDREELRIQVQKMQMQERQLHGVRVAAAGASSYYQRSCR